MSDFICQMIDKKNAFFVLFSLEYYVTVCNINYIVNIKRGDFNNEYFTKDIFSCLCPGCYQPYLCNRFYN